MKTQYILFSPDRPTLHNRGWTGNRDVTSSGLSGPGRTGGEPVQIRQEVQSSDVHYIMCNYVV
jgi:hypothetical protein